MEMRISNSFYMPFNVPVVLGAPPIEPQAGPAFVGGIKVYITHVEYTGEWYPGKLVGLILSNNISLDKLQAGTIIYQDEALIDFYGDNTC